MKKEKNRSHKYIETAYSIFMVIINMFMLSIRKFTNKKFFSVVFLRFMPISVKNIYSYNTYKCFSKTKGLKLMISKKKVFKFYTYNGKWLGIVKWALYATASPSKSVPIRHSIQCTEG